MMTIDMYTPPLQVVLITCVQIKQHRQNNYGQLGSKKKLK